MKLERVAKLLKKIHSSKALVQMIQRLGKQPLHAQELLQQLQLVLRGDIRDEENSARSSIFNGFIKRY